jgi:hypothetical protein
MHMFRISANKLSIPSAFSSRDLEDGYTRSPTLCGLMLNGHGCAMLLFHLHLLGRIDRGRNQRLFSEFHHTRPDLELMPLLFVRDAPIPAIDISQLVSHLTLNMTKHVSLHGLYPGSHT